MLSPVHLPRLHNWALYRRKGICAVTISLYQGKCWNIAANRQLNFNLVLAAGTGIKKPEPFTDLSCLDPDYSIFVCVIRCITPEYSRSDCSFFQRETSQRLLDDKGKKVLAAFACTKFRTLQNPPQLQPDGLFRDTSRRRNWWRRRVRRKSRIIRHCRAILALQQMSYCPCQRRIGAA